MSDTEKTETPQEAFVRKYGELVKETNFDFASYPVFIPDGNGGFKIVIQTTAIDVSNQPKKSPFVATE